jgi:hypothetical protein
MDRATDLIGELLAQFARPLPHGFVADDDAVGSEQLLHHAEIKREAEIEPYGMADNLGRKPIAGIAEASERRHHHGVAARRSAASAGRASIDTG